MAMTMMLTAAAMTNMYDPGGIGTSSTFSGATQASTTNNITNNSSPFLTHMLFPSDHDDTDHINTRSDTNGLGNAANLNISISSSTHDCTLTCDDDSTDSTCNSSSSLLSLHAPHLLVSTANIVHNSHSNDHKLVFDLGGTINNGLGLIKSDDSRIVYDPGGIGFSKDSTLGGINDGDGSLPYDPGGDTNDESDDRDFVYDPGGDHFDNNSSRVRINNNPSTSNLSCTDHLNDNKGSSDNFYRYELAQAMHLVFNAAPPPSADDHPSLPSANSPPQSGEDADATPQQVSTFVVCVPLSHAVYRFFHLLTLEVE